MKELAEHGTTPRYRQGCRCQPCKTANADWSATQRAVYRATAAVDPSVIPEHGTLTSYAQWGCRCEKCVEHVREYDRVRRLKAKARRKAAEQVFTFTAETLPAEMVEKYGTCDGFTLAGLAGILNAYEAWRHEQTMTGES